MDLFTNGEIEGEEEEEEELVEFIGDRVITKVTQNNTNMYTKEISQWTFKNTKQQFGCEIWMGLPKPQQWNSTNQKIEQDKPQFMMVKFQNVMIPMHSVKKLITPYHI